MGSSVFAVLVLGAVLVARTAAVMPEIESTADELRLWAKEVSFGAQSQGVAGLTSLSSIVAQLAELATVKQDLADLQKRVAMLEAAAPTEPVATSASVTKVAMDVSTVTQDVKDLKTTFDDKARDATGQHLLKTTWVSNNPNGTEAFFYLGYSNVEDPLHIDFSDVGCNSHFGTSRRINGLWNANPIAHDLGDATPDHLSDRFQFYFKKAAAPMDKTQYHLALRVTGWPNCGPSTGGNTHHLTVNIRSAQGTFKDLNDPSLNPGAQREADYKKMVLVNDVSTQIAEFGSNSLHLYNLLNRWTSNRPTNNDNWFIIGKVQVEDVLSIKFHDLGCNSHFGFAFEVTGRWGLLRPGHQGPVAISLGDASPDDLTGRFQFFYRSLSQTEFYLALKTNGWDACGANKAGVQHQSRYRITSAFGGFVPSSQMTAAVIAAETEDKYKQVQSRLDIAEKTTELFALKPVIKTPTWRVATKADLDDFNVNKADVSITSAGGLKITIEPTDRGCGTGTGSNAHIYFRGAWTQISYTQTIYGSTSCYGIFGSEAYDSSHAASLDAGNSFEIDGNENFYGAVEHSLFPYDASKGDTITSVNRMNIGDLDSTVFNGKTSFCAGGSSIWGNLPAQKASHCVPATNCVACSFGPLNKCYVGPRSATVTLRRRHNEFADGTKQYSESAGLSVGTSCTTLSGPAKVRSEFTNIRLYTA